MKKKFIEPAIILLMIAPVIYLSPFPARSTISFVATGLLLVLGSRIYSVKYGTLQSLKRSYRLFRTVLFFLIIMGSIIHNWILIPLYVGMYAGNHLSLLTIPRLVILLTARKLRKLCNSFTKLSEEEKRELRKNKKLFLTQEHYESGLLKSKGTFGPFTIAEGGNVAYYISTALDKNTDTWKSIKEEVPPEIFGLVSVFFMRMFAFFQERKYIKEMDNYLYAGKGPEYNPDYEEMKRRRQLEDEVTIFKKKWGNVDPRAT